MTDLKVMNAFDIIYDIFLLINVVREASAEDQGITNCHAEGTAGQSWSTQSLMKDEISLMQTTLE